MTDVNRRLHSLTPGRVAGAVLGVMAIFQQLDLHEIAMDEDDEKCSLRSVT